MKSILLIGLGRFGKHIAMELHSLGHQVMAIDHHEERINEALSFVTNAQIGDSTSEDFLSSLGVRNFDVCIVAIGNDFQSSLETTSLLKELGARQVVSRAARDVHPNFCCATARMRLFIPKNSWPNGPRSAAVPTISAILLILTATMICLRWTFLTTGSV